MKDGAQREPGWWRQRVRAGADYARLMRLDRPVGIWLLLWPTLWGLWLAGAGHPDPRHFLIFVAGVLLMRSAGCVVNDLADRRIDPHVRRTAGRPLATGAVSTAEAIVLAVALGLLAAALLVALNPLTRVLAVGAVVLTVLYPLTKRFFSAPQVVLGAAFGWGIPMAFAAETNAVPRVAWLWWMVVVVWAVIYDTMYAMADREDDRRLGVRSTAVLFGSADLFILTLLAGVMAMGLVLAGQASGLGPWYYAGVGAASLGLLRQLWHLRSREPAACLEAFRDNQAVGATVFAGIVLHYTFSS